MVQFAPYTNPPTDPNYLGLSKEIDVPRAPNAAATAVSGVGNTIIAGIGAVDELNKDTIDRQVLAGVNAERDESINTGLGILSGQQAPGATDATGAPDVPANINQELRRAEQITQAKKMGRVEDVNYYGNMQEIAQRLISRYPGYERYINDRMSHWLGSNPANAQRAAILNTMQTLHSADSTENRWAREVHGDQKYFLDTNGQFNMAMWNKALTAGGNPQQQAEVRTFIAQQKVFEHRRQLEAQGLALERAAGDVKEDRALTSYRVQATNTLQGHLDRYRFQLGNNSYNFQNMNQLINALIDKDGGVVDREALSRLGLSVGQLRETIKADLIKLSQNPDFTTSVKDRAKLQAIQTDLLNTFSELEKHVGEKNLHLFTNDLNTLAGIKERDAVQAVRTSADARRWATYSHTFGGQIGSAMINLENAKEKFQKMDSIMKGVSNATMRDVLSGGNLSLQNALERYNLGIGVPTTPEQQQQRTNFLNHQIEFAQNVITNPKALPEHKERAARYIANGGTTEFLNKLPPAEQMSAWSRMAAPQIAASVKQNVTPSQWREYRTWAQETFKSLLNTQIAQVTQASQGSPGNITFDEGSNELRFSDARRSQSIARSRNAPPPISRQSQEAINEINLGLSTYANILKLDGKKLDEHELGLLGINLSKKNSGGSKGSGSGNKRTSDAPNGSEGPPSVTFALGFSQENPPNMGPTVGQFTRDPTGSFTRVQNPNERVQGGFRSISEAEMDNPGLYVHDDQGIGEQLRRGFQ